MSILARRELRLRIALAIGLMLRLIVRDFSSRSPGHAIVRSSMLFSAYVFTARVVLTMSSPAKLISLPPPRASDPRTDHHQHRPQHQLRGD